MTRYPGETSFRPGLAWSVHESKVMPILQHLLQRLGFIKLDRYGLVLTPEDRILSLHPTVLDDGAGGRIVGWKDHDMAMFELKAWAPAQSTVVRALASRVSMPLIAAPEIAPSLINNPVITANYADPPVPVAASVEVMAVAVAPGPTVDEDDWEWTIALARARGATEEAEAAALVGPPPPAPPRPSPPTTRPMAVVATRDSSSGSSVARSKTAPFGAIDGDASRAPAKPGVTVPRVAPAAPPPAMPRAAAPATVIPVPPLPSIQGTARGGRLEPVVRPISASSASAPTSVPTTSGYQLAKGSGPVDPPPPSRHASMSDDTESNLRVGDRTKPGIALPPAARAVQLPSVKRRLAARR